MDKEKFLPWSARRYYISPLGEVFHFNGEKVKVITVDKKPHVELTWILGHRLYELAFISLIVFHHVKLDTYLWKYIEPLYIDNDFNNTSSGNITYRFKNGPIEVEDYPGYFYIPFSTNYGISKTGSLINLSTGKEKVWSKTKPNIKRNSKGGYSYSRVLSDTGTTLCIFRHRVLCMVFKGYSNDIYTLVVNHKDGDPTNDSLDNLEWSTYGENNRHALDTGLRTKVKPVLMMDLQTGEIRSFLNAAAAARELNYGKRGDVIKERIAEFPNIVRSDLLAFKYDDGSEWPKIDLDNIDVKRTGFSGDIIARNVFTGNLIIIDNGAAGEHLTGVKADTITSHVRNEKVLPIMGYNFRYKRANIKWPKHSKYHLITYEKYPIKPPNGVIVKDIETNSETYYPSKREACKYFNLSKSRISELIREKRPLNSRYLFSLFRLTKHIRSD